MSKTLTINIEKSTVLEHVEMQTEYVGAKHDDYKHKSAFDANEDILGKFWDEAKSVIKRKLGEFPATYTAGDDYVAVYKMARTWDYNQEEAINSLASDAAEDYISSKWYEMVGEPDLAKGRLAEYAAAITWALELMQMKLAHKENKFKKMRELKIELTAENADPLVLHTTGSAIKFNIEAYMYAINPVDDSKKSKVIPHEAQLVFDGDEVDTKIDTETGKIYGTASVTESVAGTYSYPVFCRAKYRVEEGYDFKSYGECNSDSVTVADPTGVVAK